MDSNDKAALVAVGGAILAIFLVIFCIASYTANIVKFVKADFKEPYKTEVIRGIGIAFGPLGVMTGFMDIGEENDDE